MFWILDGFGTKHATMLMYIPGICRTHRLLNDAQVLASIILMILRSPGVTGFDEARVLYNWAVVMALYWMDGVIST